MTGGTAASPKEALIEVRHLCTRFGSAIVHDDVSLVIYRGEMFAIAGGNGCGKSTLLREIILLLTPNSGTIHVFGQETKGMSEKAERALHRRIGVMFQYGALFSSLTVVENVEAPLREHTTLSKKLIRELALVTISLTGFPM